MQCKLAEYFCNDSCIALQASHVCHRGIQLVEVFNKSMVSVDVKQVLLYVHRNHRLIRDGSPGRPPRFSHGS